MTHAPCGVCGGYALVDAIDNHGQPYRGCARCRLMTLEEINAIINRTGGIVTKADAVAKIRILLGEVAASSTQRNEPKEKFVETLEAMRYAIERAIARCADD